LFLDESRRDFGTDRTCRTESLHGVERVGDALPESGQEADWAKPHPPAPLFIFIDAPNWDLSK
jgi:hypothetical protein